MGGVGSGPRPKRNHHWSTDEALRLSILDLARDGQLVPGERTRFYWHDPDRGLIVGAALLTAEEGALRVRAIAGGDREVREEAIRIEWTPCRFGGKRPWFLCHGCAKRKLVLYSEDGLFDCRNCLGLVYASTREGRMKRAQRRYDGLCERLERKGLHGRTVGRLHRERLKQEAILRPHYAKVRADADAEFVAFARSMGFDNAEEIMRRVDEELHASRLG